MMLEKNELAQYQRQIILPELGREGQEKLKAAKILMVGAGGLGCSALQYLVAAGVGTLGIIDDDRIEQSNLHRQILYTAQDVGQLKAETAKTKLKTLNPYVQINDYSERLNSINAESLIRNYDLVVDGTDNFPTRYLTNDTCVALSKPLVFGSILKFEGQVSVFNYLNGPNYRDLFPESPSAEEVPNCAEIGVIGVLPGIIGLYMANEVLKIVCGMGETLSGKLMTYHALDNAMVLFKIDKQKVQPDMEKPQEMIAQFKPLAAEITEGNGKQEISLDQLTRWLEEIPDEIFLVDVREPYEYEDYNIGGLNLPLYELADQLERLPTNKKLVICCQTGQRSKIAINILKPIYKGELYHVKNGI